MKETKGITLIALVITIVILIILATVAIGNITGSGGLLDRAQEGTEAYKVNEIKEKMEIAKATEWMDSLGNITPDGYFEQLEQEGIIGDKDADVEAVNEDEGIYNVTTDEGYIFEVTIDEDGNVEIEYVGKGEAVGPRVTRINLVGKTTSSVEIEVETIRAEGATYTYSYKKVSETTYTTPENQDNNSNRYNYTGLEANETYNFRVVVTDKAGRTAEGITNWTTATIPSGDEGIVVGEVEWSGGKASVTVSTNEEGYTLEYQKNDGGWQAVPEGGVIGNLDHGDIVDIRLTNGTSYGEETTITIEDTEDPVITEFKETAITESSIAVSVTANDNSGGALTYEYKIGEGEYTTGTNTSTHTFEGLVAGKEYEMVVRVTDQAGRSVTKTLTKTTNAMPGKETINVGITSWNNGQATITVSTTETGYELKYQKNNDGSWIEIANGGTISGLVHGDAIDVILTNGISNSEELTFNVQDTEDPVISEFKETEVTENSIAVSVTASDNSNGTLTYEYRKGSEGFVTGGTTYTFSGLEASTQYTLEVKVTDGAGRSVKKTLQVTTDAGIATVVSELKAGDYVKYVDGTGVTRTYAVLYDLSSGYGVQITAMEPFEETELGIENQDQTAAVEAGLNDYNNIITKLNNAVSKYLNTTYASSVRSMGTHPDAPTLDEAGIYAGIVNAEHYEPYRGTMKDTDEHYLTDYNQIVSLGIESIGETYLLASRVVNLGTDRLDFCVREISSKGVLSDIYCAGFSIPRGRVSVHVTDIYVRPVITLKNEIKVVSGDGSLEKPYTLSV